MVTPPAAYPYFSTRRRSEWRTIPGTRIRPEYLGWRSPDRYAAPFIAVDHDCAGDPQRSAGLGRFLNRGLALHFGSDCPRRAGRRLLPDRFQVLRASTHGFPFGHAQVTEVPFFQVKGFTHANVGKSDSLCAREARDVNAGELATTPSIQRSSPGFPS